MGGKRDGEKGERERERRGLSVKVSEFHRFH